MPLLVDATTPVKASNTLNSGLVLWLLQVSNHGWADGASWKDLVTVTDMAFSAAMTWLADSNTGGNGSLETDGTNYVIVPAAAALNDLGPMTLSFSFKRLTSAVEGAIFSKDDGNVTNGDWWVNIQHTGATDLGFGKELGSANIRVATTSGLPALSTWVKIILTWDGSDTATNVHIYEDGTEVGSYSVQVNGSGTRASLGQDLWIGKGRGGGAGDFNSAGPISFQINDICLWNRVLSGAEIASVVSTSNAGNGSRLNLASVSNPMPEVRTGPPMRLAPWFKPMAPPTAGAPTQPILVNTQPYPETRLGPPLRGAPWFKPMTPPVVIQAAPPPIAVTTYAPEVRGGPPLRGAPWLQHLPVPTAIYQPPVIVPLVTAPQSYAPEIHGGPPFPGAPWFHVPTAAPTDPGAVPVKPAPVPGQGKGHNVTLIQRDPTQLQPLRRNTEIMATIINSLVGQGLLVQTGPSTWTLAGTTSGLTGTFTTGAH